MYYPPVQLGGRHHDRATPRPPTALRAPLDDRNVSARPQWAPRSCWQDTSLQDRRLRCHAIHPCCMEYDADLHGFDLPLVPIETRTLRTQADAQQQPLPQVESGEQAGSTPFGEDHEYQSHGPADNRRARHRQTRRSHQAAVTTVLVIATTAIVFTLFLSSLRRKLGNTMERPPARRDRANRLNRQRQAGLHLGGCCHSRSPRSGRENQGVAVECDELRRLVAHCGRPDYSDVREGIGAVPSGGHYLRWLPWASLGLERSLRNRVQPSPAHSARSPCSSHHGGHWQPAPSTAPSTGQRHDMAPTAAPAFTDSLSY